MYSYHRDHARVTIEIYIPTAHSGVLSVQIDQNFAHNFWKTLARVAMYISYMATAMYKKDLHTVHL